MSGGEGDPRAKAALTSLIQQFDRSQWLAPDEIAARQRAQLVRLAEHSVRYSPHFRERMRAAGLSPRDLSAPGGLQRLPVMSRRELQANAASAFCTDVPKADQPVGETRTSGSTGEPVVVRRTALNHLIWMAMTMRELLWRAVDFTGRFTTSRATIGQYAEEDAWGAPASWLFRTGRAQAIPITASIEDHARWIAGFAPQILMIYPSTLEGLSRHCQTSGVRFDGLRLIKTIGETLRPEVRALAASMFDVPIADNYSSQEIGIIALQCPESGLYHVMGESALVEVLRDDGAPCGEGESGRVVLTDLHNFATPVVRYDIGDYAEIAGPCPCGRGLSTLRRILGRERNLILMPDGSRHWPLVGFARFRDVAPVVQYQMIQRTREDIEVRLVVEAPLTVTQETALRGVIADALGHAFRIDLRYFEGHLPRGTGGKFEEFICAVK